MLKNACLAAKFSSFLVIISCILLLSLPSLERYSLISSLTTSYSLLTSISSSSYIVLNRLANLLLVSAASCTSIIASFSVKSPPNSFLSLFIVLERTVASIVCIGTTLADVGFEALSLAIVVTNTSFTFSVINVSLDLDNGILSLFFNVSSFSFELITEYGLLILTNELLLSINPYNVSISSFRCLKKGTVYTFSRIPVTR